jgi:amino acid adenylation domain-containing protein
MNPSIHAPREGALRNQDRLFRKLLQTVWQKSAFYREYYFDHGIHRLAELSVSDLPFVTKKLLMESFDRVVTDARLRKSQIERWLNDVRDPRQLFHRDFIVMHSSGSSGTIGIFVYSRTDWNIMNSIRAARLPQPENYPAGKTRVGFYRAAHGHFAGVATAIHLPTLVYDTLIVSVLDPAERVIEQLQRFQPHRMTGYSSSIEPLAQWAIEGRLRIQPQRIFVSGDLLIPSTEQTIRQAWGAPISNLYGASESLFLAIQETDDKAMTLMDDLNVLKILDSENDEVAPGEEGRVVITNLYNHTLRVLRYELGDWVVKGKALASGFSSIEGIQPGKASDALPIILDDGTRERLSPRALTSFYAPGLERAQFIFREPDRVQIDYAAKETINDEVSKEFRRILTMKGASKMAFTTRRVPSIPADPKTGKVRLVVLDETAMNEPLQVRDTPAQTVAKPKDRAAFSSLEIEGSIVARFERQAHNHADRLAIKSGNSALTYDELNRASNRVAHTVLARSGESAEPIGILLKPGIAAVVAILGILKAGKFYLPLDAGFPHARLAAIVKDAEPHFILTENALLPSAMALTEDAERIVNIDALDAGIPDHDPSLTTVPDAYAYLLYTSGSSGQPKGVTQNHRNVLHQLASYTDGLGLCAEDRLTFLHSHCFSASRLDIFGALLNGAALFHFDVGEQGAALLARWLHEEEITVMHWVPTPFRHFADGLREAGQFPALRSIVLGSETLTAHDLQLYRRHFASGCTLVNRFGTTETGNIAWHFIDERTALTGSAVPIGRPIDGVEVLLLDETGKQVVDAEIGEITVKSRYLPQGYWRQPELTRSAFASDAAGIGLYRTGDLGYRLADGCLVYAGRKDSQAKVRGYRVDINEIETALLAHPAIREAAVAVGEEESGAQKLLAYLVAREAPRPTNGVLRTHLRARLPSHMIPATFTWLEHLPLTQTGKLDRRALSRYGDANAERDTAFAEPRTPVEQALASIWVKALGVARVGLHDNFFELGGHSLSAAHILQRVVRIFGVEMQLRDFFDSPTIARMAEIIGRERAQDLDDDLRDLLVHSGYMSEDENHRLLKEVGGS